MFSLLIAVYDSHKAESFSALDTLMRRARPAHAVASIDLFNDFVWNGPFAMNFHENMSFLFAIWLNCFGVYFRIGAT